MPDRAIMFAKRKCRGGAQCSWARRLVEGRCINPILELRGRAREYALRYNDSFYALCQRFEHAGIRVHKQPGPRGGTGMMSGCFYADENDLRRQFGDR